MRPTKLIAIFALALAVMSCREKSALDIEAPAAAPQAAPSSETGMALNATDDDVPKVSCNRGSVNDFGGHIGTCTEYFVGPEESLQVDKAAELEAACVEEGGVWDVQACRVEKNLLGTCKTPAGGMEPAINELVYGSNTPPLTGDVSDDSQTNCATPSAWVEAG